MAFQLPEKEKLFVELRKGGRGYRVEGALKDAVYKSLSEKNLVRARTPFNIEDNNYTVLDYDKHGDSANISILKISKKGGKT